MPEPADEWEDGEQGLTPPEPAPADWVRPAPVEAQIHVAPGITLQEETDMRKYAHWKRRRFLTTTFVFFALWLGVLAIVHIEGALLAALLLLLPLYLLTLPFVLRTPKALRAKHSVVDRVSWRARLMISVLVFLILYVPFTFFSNEVIPFAPLIEYMGFALLLLLLLRLGAASEGLAPSLEALPPPTHRLHQQIVAPIDDAHYQRTLWLNFAFVEKGKGAKDLSRRLDHILQANGVRPERRREILAPLEAEEATRFTWTKRGRERRAAGRERRSQVLEAVFRSLTHELEQAA